MNITNIVTALIGLLCTIITTFVVPWINTKIKNEKVKTVINITYQIVQAAQELQITGELEQIGLTKADYAWSEAKKALAEKNISIDDDELKAYIKSAVTELRKEIQW